MRMAESGKADHGDGGAAEVEPVGGLLPLCASSSRRSAPSFWLRTKRQIRNPQPLRLGKPIQPFGRSRPHTLTM